MATHTHDHDRGKHPGGQRQSAKSPKPAAKAKGKRRKAKSDTRKRKAQRKRLKAESYANAESYMLTARGEQRKSHLDLDGGIRQELHAVSGLEGAFRDSANAGGAALPDCHHSSLASRVLLCCLKTERKSRYTTKKHTYKQVAQQTRTEDNTLRRAGDTQKGTPPEDRKEDQILRIQQNTHVETGGTTDKDGRQHAEKSRRHTKRHAA